MPPKGLNKINNILAKFPDVPKNEPGDPKFEKKHLQEKNQIDLSQIYNSLIPIDVVQFYQIIKTRNCVIIEIRPLKQFINRHIKYFSCFNIDSTLTRNFNEEKEYWGKSLSNIFHKEDKDSVFLFSTEPNNSLLFSFDKDSTIYRNHTVFHQIIAQKRRFSIHNSYILTDSFEKFFMTFPTYCYSNKIPNRPIKVIETTMLPIPKNIEEKQMEKTQVQHTKNVKESFVKDDYNILKFKKLECNFHDDADKTNNLRKYNNDKLNDVTDKSNSIISLNGDNSNKNSQFLRENLSTTTFKDTSIVVSSDVPLNIIPNEFSKIDDKISLKIQNDITQSAIKDNSLVNFRAQSIPITRDTSTNKLDMIKVDYMPSSDDVDLQELKNNQPMSISQQVKSTIESHKFNPASMNEPETITYEQQIYADKYQKKFPLISDENCKKTFLNDYHSDAASKNSTMTLKNNNVSISNQYIKSTINLGDTSTNFIKNTGKAESLNAVTSMEIESSSSPIASLNECQTSYKNKAENLTTTPYYPVVNRSEKPIMKNDSNQNLNIDTNFSALDRSVPEPYMVGLQNNNMICYMNSVLQCLFSIDAFVRLIGKAHLLIQKKLYINVKVLSSLSYIQQEMASGKKHYVPMTRFSNIIFDLVDHFQPGVQQDAQEFLILLISQIEDELKLLSDDDTMKTSSSISILENFKSIFYGSVGYITECCSCHYRSLSCESFTNLTLPLCDSNGIVFEACSLETCLSQYFSPFKISLSYQWKCDNCKDIREAVKTSVIKILPKLLIIHLSRNSTNGGKIRTLVSYPITKLTLSLESSAVNQNRCSYDFYLKSVVHHHGNSTTSGHYTATCNKSLENQPTWIEYDDLLIRKLTNNPTNSVVASTGYLLFYQTN